MKRIFYDIETAPNVALVWRPGYRLSVSAENIISERFVICICWLEEGDKTVQYLTCDEENNDEEMIKHFADVINEADEIVAHNGDRFDFLDLLAVQSKAAAQALISQIVQTHPVIRGIRGNTCHKACTFVGIAKF